MSITPEAAVIQLLRIVQQLRNTYQKKRFTLDGRLLGDLGEILVEREYDVVLYESLEKHHDAEMRDGRKVQIKATMQNTLTFPVERPPDYYLGIQINPNGAFTEVFNGPGCIAAKAVQNRKPTKTNLHSVSISALKRLNEEVLEGDRLPRRVETIPR